MVDINDYVQEKSCTYKGELYKVRDNGAIMRLTPQGKNKRKLDNEWTFGTKNEKNGYMTIAGHRVHIIVATAFFGPKDSKTYVVDHKDTNRCNNRPENLRWLTRLENVLKNEITREKIIYICGSIESFLEDPSQLNGYENENPNFAWMRTVTPEEAKNCLENWKRLQKNPKEKHRQSEPISEWIYSNPHANHEPENNSNVPQYSHIDRVRAILKEKEEKERAEKEEKKKLEEEIKKAKKKLKNEQKKTVRDAIISIAKSKGWQVEKNVSGNGWKADVVITTSTLTFGIILYKSTRKAKDDLNAMKAEGISGCGLGCSDKDYKAYNEMPLPLFDVEISDCGVIVKFDSGLTYNLVEFIQSIADSRLKTQTEIDITKIKVRFCHNTCYKCNKKHFTYYVNGVINEKVPSLINFQNSGTYVGIDCFCPDVIKAVKKYLYEHPEYNYPIGEIKERYSKTCDKSYLSFGCPECDAIVGDFYLSETYIDTIYERDDEDVHVINLEKPGIKMDYKRWVIE